MDDFVIKRNTPIARLIKDFRNKRSKKVVESRKEIQRRFAYLDWRDQKKILTVFLDSCKTDWQWACGKLLYCWDDCFTHKLKELWELSHDINCSWTIIRHFPIDYILDHEADLDMGRNYYFICKRLANEGITIPIERSRFTMSLDYLSALSLMKQPIPEEEATDMLYRIIHKACTDLIPSRPQEYIPFNSHYLLPGALSFISVVEAVKILMNMEQFRVVARFHECNYAICEAIVQSDFYSNIDKFFLDINARLNIARKYCYSALPAKYKASSLSSCDNLLLPHDAYPVEPIDPTILSDDLVDSETYEELKNECPCLEQLINQFDLAPFPVTDYSSDSPPF